ncbi:biotin/lipoyl-binding protein, partial [Azospirillum sp. B506]|uniref:biotin/lipoyl-binding protein n=1 Tax=Azospirillum sp. B506 TaxID=137721 RepID=UPI0005B2630A
MTTMTTTFPAPLSSDNGSETPAGKPSRKSATITSIHALRATMPETGVRGLLLGGFLVLAVGFGGMAGWAAVAPLHSAISASGSLAPETGRKVVKNTEGGVISAILVNEGDRVQAGQILMRLDSTEAQTRLEMLNAALFDTLASEARLSAELFEKPAIEWPAELAARRAKEPAAENAMVNQEKLFQVRRNQLDTESKLTQDRIATLGD